MKWTPASIFKTTDVLYVPGADGFQIQERFWDSSAHLNVTFRESFHTLQSTRLNDGSDENELDVELTVGGFTPDTFTLDTSRDSERIYELREGIAFLSSFTTFDVDLL